MALRIRYAYPPGASLGYSIERLADGLYYDFANTTFTTTPAVQINTLTSQTGNFSGLYRDTIATTPQSVFSNGEYAVNIHSLSSLNAVIGVLGLTMYAGDTAPVFTATGSDPWLTILPGAYTSGTAGAILGGYLDAQVSSRSTYAGGPVASVISPVTVGTNTDKYGYTLTQGFPGNFANLAVSPGGQVTVGTNNDKAGYSLNQAFPANFASLSVNTNGQVSVGTNMDKSGYSLVQTFPANFANLAVSMSGQVTIGINNDKVGYSLGANGLDGIAVEPGVNVRQALSPILAAAGGTLSGAGTGTIVIRGGNVATTRITATTDNAGNRSTVTLSLPN